MFPNSLDDKSVRERSLAWGPDWWVMDGIPSESPRVAIHHGIEIISFLRTLGVKEAAIKADIAGTSFMSIYQVKHGMYGRNTSRMKQMFRVSTTSYRICWTSWFWICWDVEEEINSIKIGFCIQVCHPMIPHFSYPFLRWFLILLTLHCYRHVIRPELLR